MKKFSKTAHHSLTELNITPLLDLAFVLLVIFIITTTPVVNDLELSLPSAARRQKDPKAKENFVTVDNQGRVFLNQKELPMTSLLEEISLLRQADPDLNIVLRGDRKTKYSLIVGVLDTLQQANLGKVNLATEPFAAEGAK